MPESGEVRRDGGRTERDRDEPAPLAARGRGNPGRRHARSASARGALLIALVALLGATAQAQSGPTSPPPVATPPTAPAPPASAPIEPLTAGPANASPTFAPGLFAAPAPAAPADAPPIGVAAAPAHEPFYQKWWFWTAVGAVAVTTFVILIATSGSNAPHTDFGNMPAF